MKLKVNGQLTEVTKAWQNETLLSVLREQFGLMGAKLGCGQGDCGTCVVHINGQAERSCQISVQDLPDADIITIEGLEKADGRLHPVQQAWLDQRVAQCGFCQAGQIMQAAALLANNQQPSDQDINEQMRGNLCRCGTHNRIRAAINVAAEVMRSEKSST